MTLTQTPAVDSESIGEAGSFVALAHLEQRLRDLPPAPRDLGSVVLLVARGENGRRHYLERAALAPGAGMPGDSWTRKPGRKPDAELAVMHAPVAQLIANGQPLGLFGDNLFIDLDLSQDNLPHGSTLRIGAARFIVTPEPHNGCKKFHARFGADALRFVSRREQRSLNLRGIYLRVIEAGMIGVGDAVEVLSRTR